MRARLIPLYFDPGRDGDFDRQLAALRTLLSDDVEMLDPVALGNPLPEADAVLFPQLLGEAYRRVEAFRAIPLPRLIVTSEVGTLSMWDWEIIEYLRSHGIETIAPYHLEQTKAVCAALGIKRALRGSRFLVYQDNPGEGHQASIFKRFYWWEEECTRRMQQKFGVAIVRKSFREHEADRALAGKGVATDNLSARSLCSAAKLYLAVKDDLRQDPSIRGVGINCLNESHFADTTPCLAWSLLFEEQGLTWGCEADTMSMLTQHLLLRPLGAPLMMTNLYPFLMGEAATRHERIPGFPPVDGAPENFLLVAHCGYAGLIPRPFATKWTLRPKVLAIVDQNATAVDARLPAGDVTLAKLHPTMDKMTVAEGTLTGYVQFAGSDCLNGGLVKVRDGRRLIDSLASHHYVLAAGRHAATLRVLAKVFGLNVEEIGP